MKLGAAVAGLLVLGGAAAGVASWSSSRVSAPAATAASPATYRVPAGEPCTAAQYSQHGARALFGDEPSTSTRRKTLARLKLPSGAWPDAYLGISISDPGSMDVDHVVSLQDAWVSGACHWPYAQRRAFGRDQANLVLTLARVNRSKGDDTADVWVQRWPAVARTAQAPLPTPAAVCDFLTTYATVKRAHALTGMPTPRAGCAP